VLPPSFGGSSTASSVTAGTTILVPRDPVLQLGKRRIAVGQSKAEVTAVRGRRPLLKPDSLAAKSAHGSAESRSWLVKQKGITPLIPVFGKSGWTDGTLSRADFAFDPERDRYIGPRLEASRDQCCETLALAGRVEEACLFVGKKFALSSTPDTGYGHGLRVPRVGRNDGRRVAEAWRFPSVRWIFVDMTPPDRVPVLRVVGITKTFGAANALSDVSFSVRRGEVHALVGENGAGKSTLVKIVTGILEPSSGHIELDGEPTRFATPVEARRAGVAAVYQDPKLFPHLDVAENISMGATPTMALGVVDRRAVVAQAREALARIGVAIDPRALIAELSVAELQFVEIARALAANPRLLILDEPTSSLTPAEAEKLFRIARGLRERGTAILFITHRLEELTLVADTVTVLRDGRHVATRAAAEVTRTEIVRMMVGRPLEGMFAERTKRTPGREVLRVEGLTRDGAFSNVTFALRAGEIVGMAGLVGSGRSEIAQACFGLSPPTAGSIAIDGVPVTPLSPKQMLALGLAYLPEDRDGLGLIMSAPIADNVTLPILDRLANLGFIDEAAGRKIASEAVETYHVRTTGIDQLVSDLSGGNRQKVAFARWLSTKPKVLILDEPTHGVDIGSKAQIHRIIAELADAGLAILVISSDLPEVLGVSDRILVIAEGELVAEMDAASVDQETVMMAATRNARDDAHGH
jgi:rhamnose transport system ATP-binding protein